MKSAESVTVVIATFNDSEHLADALRSVVAQRHVVSNIDVDDGSSKSPAAITAAFEGVKLIRKRIDDLQMPGMSACLTLILNS
jgi:GT2 family glycosyltransferase